MVQCLSAKFQALGLISVPGQGEEGLLELIKTLQRIADMEWCDCEAWGCRWDKGLGWSEELQSSELHTDKAKF